MYLYMYMHMYMYIVHVHVHVRFFCFTCKLNYYCKIDWLCHNIFNSLCGVLYYISLYCVLATMASLH